jgi:hypothetical protein
MLRTALSALADLSIDGVTNCDIDALPLQVKRGQLPLLLVLPLDLDSLEIERRIFGDRDGFTAGSFSNGAQTVSYNITHLLLVAPVTGGRGWRDTVPPLVDFIDAYFTALAPYVTLEGLLLEPTQVRVDAGTFTYGDMAYVGCAFRHRWVMMI